MSIWRNPLPLSSDGFRHGLGAVHTPRPSPSPRTTLSLPAIAKPHHGDAAGVARARTILADLLQANALYADESNFKEVPHPLSYLSKRQELATHGQKPVATIIACADSRVPPELLFRGTVGTLFVLRTAGNVTDDEAVLASVEYAVAVLKTPLILVMGHEKCGAVGASMTAKRDNGFAKTLPENLGSHVTKMAACLPDMDKFKGLSEEVTTNKCVVAHTVAAAEALTKASPVVDAGASAGDILVIPAVYDISTGVVRIV